MATAGEVGYWIYWGLGSVFLLACGALTWWGLFGDRARGRRRCPRCWYDLSHTESLLCPECGRAARSERQLHRTRRRLLPAATGALVASLGAAWFIEQHRQAGWMSMVPTRVLLAGLPLAGGGGSMIIDEIELRGSRRLLSPEHWEALVERCVAGDFRARPVSERWQQKYGRLLDLVDNQAPPSLDRRQLLELPPWIALESPRAWPPGVSPCLELHLRHWWPSGTECRLELAPPWRASEPIVFTRGTARSRTGYPLVVPAEEAAGGRVRFDAVVKRRGPDPSGDPGQWQEVLARPLEAPIALAAEPLERAIAADDDPELQEAVQEVFSLGVVKWSGGPSPMRVRFDPQPTFRAGFEGVAIGASVEIRRDDELVRRLDLWWRAGIGDQGQRRSGFRVDYESLALIGQANQEDGRWKMTVRGLPQVALRAGDAERYWSGEFTVPLKVDRRRRAAPPREWESSTEQERGDDR